MNTEAAKFEVSQARAWAMESGRPFSWVKTQEVQKGVYAQYSQSLFAKYIAPVPTQA